MRRAAVRALPHRLMTWMGAGAPLDFGNTFFSMASSSRVWRPLFRMSKRSHISLVAYARQPLNAHLPRLRALSEGALTVRTDGLLSPADPVEVTIYFVKANQEIRVSAEVVWVNEHLGDMALRFVSVSASDELLIADYLEQRARVQKA